jgi:hypothetical protein
MMTRTEKEKMMAGDLYDAGAPELQADMAAAHEWLARYNAALGTSISERRELLLERFAAVGEDAVIRPPFHCDYGFNITLGAGVFLNFNCISSTSWRSPSATKRRSAQRFRSSRPITHAMLLEGPPGWSLVAQSTSGATFG